MRALDAACVHELCMYASACVHSCVGGVSGWASWWGWMCAGGWVDMYGCAHMCAYVCLPFFCLPACLAACLPSCLPTYLLPSCLPTCLAVTAFSFNPSQLIQRSQDVGFQLDSCVLLNVDTESIVHLYSNLVWGSIVI